MPLPGFVTTDGGKPYSRFKAPVMSGQLVDSAGSTQVGPLPNAGGFICVQSTGTPLVQILTSSSAFPTASYVYIPQGSFAVTSSNTATLALGPPYTGSGAAMYYDFTRAKLSIFSTGGTGDWMSVTLTSS